MAEETKTPRSPAFAGAPVKPVDHRNPPKPATAVKSETKPDHFTRERPAPVSTAPAKALDAIKPKP